MNRFRELDFNGDGAVTFSEFLFGFAQWVGFGDGDDDTDATAAPADAERKEETTDFDTRSHASLDDGTADIVVRKDDRPLISSLKKRDSPRKHARRISNQKASPLPGPHSALNAPLTSLLPTLPGSVLSTTASHHHSGGSSHAVAPLAGDGGNGAAPRTERSPSIGTRKKGDKKKGHTNSHGSHGNNHGVHVSGATVHTGTPTVHNDTKSTHIQTISIVPG
jgi:hypothetical protein